jgi:hypothetical protein
MFDIRPIISSLYGVILLIDPRATRLMSAMQELNSVGVKDKDLPLQEVSSNNPRF